MLKKISTNKDFKNNEENTLVTATTASNIVDSSIMFGISTINAEDIKVSNIVDSSIMFDNNSPSM